MREQEEHHLASLYENDKPKERTPSIQLPEQKGWSSPEMLKKYHMRESAILYYPDLVSADISKRKVALIAFLQEIEQVITTKKEPNREVTASEQAELLASMAPQIYSAGDIATYYMHYLPDLVWQTVYGRLSEGRSQMFHCLRNQDALPAMTVQDLEEVYLALKKNPDEPLLDLKKLVPLKDILYPNLSVGLPHSPGNTYYSDRTYSVLFPLFVFFGNLFITAIIKPSIINPYVDTNADNKQVFKQLAPLGLLTVMTLAISFLAKSACRKGHDYLDKFNPPTDTNEYICAKEVTLSKYKEPAESKDSWVEKEGLKPRASSHRRERAGSRTHDPRGFSY